MGNTSGIKMKDKIGYALGDAGGILTFGIIGSYLQIFYTNVLMISAGKVMMLFLVARIWDAINDPIWGMIVDSRKVGKNGKFRPYLRFASPLLALSAVLVFLKIPNMSETQYLIYAYVTYILYGMCYTAVNIPYSSLASVVTSDEYERSSLSMFRSIGAGIGTLASQIILPLFVYTTVKGTKVLDGDRLFIGVFVLSVLSIFVFQLCYRWTIERVKTPEGKANTNIKKTVATLLKNRPFIVLSIASMLLLALQQYTQSIYNYLFLDYFKKPGLYSLVSVFTYLPMLILIPVIQKIVRKTGKKEICAVGMLIAAIANVILFVTHTTNPTIFFIFSFLSGFGMTFFVFEIWALATDTVDYQESMSGQRDEGTAYAFFTFARKVGQALAGATNMNLYVSRIMQAYSEHI
ncbi:MAG: glycoside-pentoside-hexuronide (GPH):cation symporter [Lachnospira sp.]|nr:glycoside-pentoside-hexuronide (GPH):cation symporter [Lachnospira sp.]